MLSNIFNFHHQVVCKMMGFLTSQPCKEVQSSLHFLQFCLDTLQTSLVRAFVFLAQNLQSATSSTEGIRLVVSYRILSFLMVLGEVGIASGFDDFLRYDWICGDDAGVDTSWGIVGVNEFQIAKAVLGGQLESLSQKVPSQWGSVHLFNVCLRFGLHDTAWALAEAGVKGCILEFSHLTIPTTGTDLAVLPAEPGFAGRCCKCSSYLELCRNCTWGFPVVQNRTIWMSDFNAKIGDAKAEAAKVVRKHEPFLDRIVSSIEFNKAIPFTITPQAMARLLDIYILWPGNHEVLTFSKYSPVRPLRRWRSGDLFGFGSSYEFRLRYIEEMIAALVSGANFGLEIEKNAELPLTHVIALAENGPNFWRDSKSYPEIDMAALLSSRIRSKPRQLPESNDLGRLLLKLTSGGWLLRKEALENAKLAAVNLKAFRVKVKSRLPNGSEQWEATLLDLAILQGQCECARLCGEMDVQMSSQFEHHCLPGFKGDFKKSFQSFKHRLASAQHKDCMVAAATAAAAALTRTWNLEVRDKGIAILQTANGFGSGRSFPALLVEEVIAFAMPVPDILQRLDLEVKVFGGRKDSVIEIRNSQLSSVEDVIVC